MEFLFSLILLPAVLLTLLRFSFHSRKPPVGPVILYVVAMVLMALLLPYSLSTANLTQLEEVQATGAALGRFAPLISQTNHFVTIYLPLPVLVACLFAAYEVFAFIWFACFRRMNDTLTQPSQRLVSHWWANLITFLVVPAFAFWIASGSYIYTNDPGRRDYTDVSHNLNPLLVLFGAPAHLLGMRNKPIDAQGNVTMFDFIGDTPPWIALSLLITMVAFRSRSNSSLPPPSVRQLLLNDADLTGSNWREKLQALPWRGKYMLVFLTLILFCVMSAIVLGVLFYGFIAFMYSAIIIVPVALLVLLVVLIMWLGKKRK